jgi:hypothetical protein
MRRKDYPKTLNIGDEVYTVKFVRKFKDRRTVGECDSSAKEIRIKTGQGPSETLKTFLHEVMHALFEFEHDVNIPHKLIYKLEAPISQFLRDNVFKKKK